MQCLVGWNDDVLYCDVPSTSYRLARNRSILATRMELRRFLGECEVKCTSFAEFGFHPNRPTMPLDDSFGNRKPQSGSWVLRSRVQSLKDDKDPICVLLLKTNSVVAHGEVPMIHVRLSVDSDSRSLVSAEFDRVSDEVLKQSYELVTVAQN